MRMLTGIEKDDVEIEEKEVEQALEHKKQEVHTIMLQVVEAIERGEANLESLFKEIQSEGKGELDKINFSNFAASSDTKWKSLVEDNENLRKEQAQWRNTTDELRAELKRTYLTSL